jgi:hypothetical protein
VTAACQACRWYDCSTWSTFSINSDASEDAMITLILVANTLWHTATQNPPPRRDYTTLNVCQLVPGESVARALGGKLSDQRPFYDKTFSRCTYLIVPPGSSKPLGYVVWVQPAADFQDLKQVIDEPLTSVSGLGDDAYMFRDAGDGRFKINVLKRGDLMFQATGESAATARQVADAVASVLWKKAP